uniref:Signal peptide peptidase n=1 Tax=Strombidium rassoulzadegani TaxID=1082188 RepID=A0A7S3FX05_9SPIT|mmetsp:Transcript_9625/g.16168  ORF Transcript_9625/g.16168 Transcript_9625/m.16168 type:complete len:396 (+) Transcript_9625:35-1222(+)
MTNSLFQKEQAACYSVLLLLTIVGIFTDVVPIQVNITLHSILIIGIGSFKSLEELLKQIKRVHIDKKGGSQNIEQMSFSDAWQFPIAAGCTLCGLYFGIQYFGKDAMNYFLVCYIAVGGTTGIKSLIESFMGDAFAEYDKDYLIDLNVKLIGLELQVTLFDLLCLAISFVQMGLYVYYKSWIYNNILALIFCIHALQSMFLGNFKNGFLLLCLLFFYDIFFVFGTDVMLTVAKGIDAPIKLMFPKDYSGEKPQYSILGLGDIVIPGVFVSLCLRFDLLKTIDVEKLSNMIEQEEKGESGVNTMKYLVRKAIDCPKHYFMAVNVGYLLAMVVTIVIMLVFEHGQPALLYLVPGCLLSVSATALWKGELGKMWNFDEEAFIASPGEDSEEEDSKKEK